MGLVNRTGYKFNNLNSLNKIIVIMILCFIAPFLINTLYFLFQIKEFVGVVVGVKLLVGVGVTSDELVGVTDGV